MPEEVKFTEEEIKKVKEIQKEYFDSQSAFGQLGVARIRLEDHPEKISIWIGKKITRDYTGTSAWFWSTAYDNNLQEEEQKLRNQKENMQIVFENFNAVHADKPTNGDVKKIEKIIDSEEEKRKDAEADEKMHSWNPNKGYWKN